MKRSKLTQSQGHIESLENRTLFSGGLDPTFGDGGIAQAGLESEQFSVVAALPNREVLAGATVGTPITGLGNVQLRRFLADGAADTSFGNNGAALAGIAGFNLQITNLLIQPDGKVDVAADILASSMTPPYQPPGGIAVLRFDADGTLDTSFGNHGSVAFPGTDSGPELFWQTGKLLVGSAQTIHRFNTNGTEDTSFRADGLGGSAFAVQANQKIVEATDNAAGNVIAYRRNTDGTLDTAFGIKGVATTSLGDVPEQALIEPDGLIVVLTSPLNYRNITGVPNHVTAINPNGAVDTNFGSAGLITVVPNPGAFTQGRALSIVQQSDGDLLVTQPWTQSFLNSATNSFYPLEGFQISQYSATGALQTAFGTKGNLRILPTTTTVPRFASISPTSAALDDSGRLLVAGSGNLTTGSAAVIFAIDTNNDTGTIAGYMFYDFNGNGKRDAGDHQLNWTCYIDVDNDGHYDNADIRIHTDAAGNFTIPNLAPGVYHIRQSGVSHWQKTTPAEYTVTVTPGATVTGVNFGSRFIT